MAVLSLIIKEHFLAEIVKGKKKIETREIRPQNSKKYIVEVGENDVAPREYESIQFYAGYNKGRKEALVKIKSAEILIVEDDKGNEIPFEHDGEMYVESIIQYSLGKVIRHNF